MAPSRTPLFNPQLFLTQVGEGKSSLQSLEETDAVFARGCSRGGVLYPARARSS